MSQAPHLIIFPTDATMAFSPIANTPVGSNGATSSPFGKQRMTQVASNLWFTSTPRNSPDAMHNSMSSSGTQFHFRPISSPLVAIENSQASNTVDIGLQSNKESGSLGRSVTSVVNCDSDNTSNQSIQELLPTLSESDVSTYFEAKHLMLNNQLMFHSKLDSIRQTLFGTLPDSTCERFCAALGKWIDSEIIQAQQQLDQRVVSLHDEMTPETLAPAIDQKSASNYTDAVLTAIQAALSLFPDDATSNDPTHNVKQQDDTDIDSDDDRAKRPTKRTRRHRSSENTDAATKRRSYRPADFDEAATRPVFTKDARLQLKEWFFGHQQYPYPTEAEKHELAEQCELTVEQVCNWFVNARARYQKSKKHALEA